MYFMTIEKRDWQKIVTESGGKRVFLPEVFMNDAKKWDEKRDEFRKETIKFAEKEVRLQFQLNELSLRVREYLAKNGYSEIWIKELGFDEEALKEGLFIVNLDLK